MKCGNIDEARNFARANKHRNSFKRTVKHVKSSAAIKKEILIQKK